VAGSGIGSAALATKEISLQIGLEKRWPGVTEAFPLVVSPRVGSMQLAGAARMIAAGSLAGGLALGRRRTRPGARGSRPRPSTTKAGRSRLPVGSRRCESTLDAATPEQEVSLLPALPTLFGWLCGWSVAQMWAFGASFAGLPRGLS